jgi:hypothetical protein
MNTAHTIRAAVAEVERLREESRAAPEIGLAVVRLKRFQARRFAGTYADLMVSQDYGAATRFFLDELYSERDYAERDAQFRAVRAHRWRSGEALSQGRGRHRGRPRATARAD